MPTPQDQTPPPTFDPDSLYAFCLDEAQAIAHAGPALSSLDTERLLWSFIMSHAHAVEMAARVFGSRDHSDPLLVMRVVGLFLTSNTPAALHDLWRIWREQHTDWDHADTLQVPLYFLSCQTHRINCLRELSRRGRHHLVFKAWAGLTAGPAQPHEVRLRRFLDAMDTTLRHTVKRKLARTMDEEAMDEEATDEEVADKESVAILGATAKKSRAEERIVKLLHSGGQTDSGLMMEVPKIPELPIRGMEGADGINRVWRDAAHDSAFKIFARIAPGILGRLETALPDAAHAKQRAGRDRADAKKRGGSGGRKAKKAGTVEPAVQHIPTGGPDENSSCIDPETLVCDRPNAEQEIEAQEEEKENQEAASRLRCTAFDRWGPRGERMLEALKDGKTDKEAAKAAGISAPALRKRLDTLGTYLRKHRSE
jgi:hypothetical protein